MASKSHGGIVNPTNAVNFPFVFHEAGIYRIGVQVKTTVFKVDLTDA